MRGYIVRRLMLMIPTIIGVSLIIFFATRFLPGDVATIMLGQEGGTISDHDISDLRHRLGLDEPLYKQYWEFMSGIPRGNLGTSLWTGRPVTDSILYRLPVTIELAVLAIALAAVAGVSLGVLSALRQDSWVDYVARSSAIMLLATPIFWIGVLVLLLPALWFGWSPRSVVFTSFAESPGKHLLQFVIPALIIASHTGAGLMRITRTLFLETMRQDYIRVAYAKGLATRVVVLRHALRNALIPVATIIGLQVAHIIGGAIIMEVIFGLPGMGRLLVEDALGRRDYPMIQGIVILAASFVLVVNLLVDLSYAVIDPRVKYANN
ncbi:MAG: ABC transporter permease [Chloroflexi bacterium]|nr:ABC transporter permease [Chloroflexota bacterium]